MATQALVSLYRLKMVNMWFYGIYQSGLWLDGDIENWR